VTARALREADVVARLRRAGCVFAEAEARMLLAAAETPEDLIERLVRREAGEPIEVVLGWAEFCGLRIAVGAGVFVPRRRTGLLVREAAVRLSRGDVVVDMCCGSGAVGSVLLSAVDGIELYAVDNDAGAVEYARRNIGARGQVLAGDLFEPVPSRLLGRVRVIVANAPYVPSEAIATMPPEARLYEPAAALDGGHDGLALQVRIINEAPAWLAPGGHLLLETGRGQADRTVAVAEAHGFAAQIVRSDDIDGTVMVATRRDSPAR